MIIVRAINLYMLKWLPADTIRSMASVEGLQDGVIFEPIGGYKKQQVYGVILKDSIWRFKELPWSA